MIYLQIHLPDRDHSLGVRSIVLTFKRPQMHRTIIGVGLFLGWCWGPSSRWGCHKFLWETPQIPIPHPSMCGPIFRKRSPSGAHVHMNRYITISCHKKWTLSRLLRWIWVPNPTKWVSRSNPEPNRTQRMPNPNSTFVRSDHAGLGLIQPNLRRKKN